MYKQRGIRARWNADRAPSSWEAAVASLRGPDDQVACLCLAASRVPPGTEQTGTFIIHACNTTQGTTHYSKMRAPGFYPLPLFLLSSLLLLRLQLKIHSATLLNIY